MMEIKINWLPVIASALIPTLIGFFWYGKSLFGNVWMKESGMTEEKAKGMNMPLTMGLALLFSLLVAVALMPVVVHQMGVFSVVQNVPEAKTIVNDFLTKYGGEFRTFKHGAFHGILTGIFLGIPLIGMPALWERKSFKYVAINAGYWIVTLALMGGVICQWGIIYK